MLKLDKRRQIFYDKKAVSELNKERWKKLAQKAGDKIRQGSLRLAMLMTTLIGNGSATGSNPARGIFFFVRKDDDHRPGRQNGASRQHRHR